MFWGGTSTSKGTQGSVGMTGHPACREPSSEITVTSRRVLGAAVAARLLGPQSQADGDPAPASVGEKSTSHLQSRMLERLQGLQRERLQVSDLGWMPASCQEHPSCHPLIGHGWRGQPGNQISRGSQQLESHPGFLGT